MACAARMRLQLPPSRVECYAFGSPPVLARANKADARDVLQVHICSIAVLTNMILKGRSSLWDALRVLGTHLVPSVAKSSGVVRNKRARTCTGMYHHLTADG